MKLSDLKVGQTWYVNDPVRIGRIVEETTARFREPIMRDNVERKAFRVRVALPVKEITGLVTAKQARINQKLSEAITKDDEATDTTWFEIWSERMVPQLINPEGSGAQQKGTEKIFEDDCVPQLFCHSVAGRAKKRDHTSPVLNRPIDVTVVAASMIIWEKKVDATENKVQEASAAAERPVAKKSPRKRKRRSDAGKRRPPKQAVAQAPQEVTA